MDSVGSKRWVNAAIELAIRNWSACSGPWFPSGPQYSPQGQKQREKAWDRALKEVRQTCRAQTNRTQTSRARNAEAESRLTHAFARFGAEALDLGTDAIDLLTHGFLPVAKQLGRWAHRFDPTLTAADITQAVRNAWTACGMQPLFGAPLRLTPSILGYSLLYPYSDNYLDQRAVTHEDKVRFSRRFRSRLRGESLQPADRHEAAVWEMVRLIESEFPRRIFPQVFDALLAIHAAQEESVRQLDECGRIDARELLRISCAKGGTSVLADACLIRGTLEREESEFAFLWGVLLQLGDDLQDVAEDLERGSDTLFTRAVRNGVTLDGLVDQLLNFSELAGARLNALPDAPPDALTRGISRFRCIDPVPRGLTTHKDLLRMSWRSLILMSVAQAHAFFSPAFLQQVEPCSPFRFAFLRERRKKLNGDRGLFERIFELVLNSADQSPDELAMGTIEPILVTEAVA